MFYNDTNTEYETKHPFYCLDSNIFLEVILLFYMFSQKCKSLHFPTKTVEMPNTDVLTYLMYKTMKGALVNLKDSLDGAFSKDFNRISDKGTSFNIFKYHFWYMVNERRLSPFLVISLKDSNDPSGSEKIKGM